jgi:ribosomal protein L44E
MKVFSSKKKNRSALKRGSKQRAMMRGLNRGSGNKGRFSKGALSSWKRYNKKSSKKTDLRYKCSVCGKTVCQSHGIRTKRLELV